MTIDISNKLPKTRKKRARRRKISRPLPDRAPSQAFLTALDVVGKMGSAEK